MSLKETEKVQLEELSSRHCTHFFIPISIALQRSPDPRSTHLKSFGQCILAIISLISDKGVASRNLLNVFGFAAFMFTPFSNLHAKREAIIKKTNNYNDYNMLNNGNQKKEWITPSGT